MATIATLQEMASLFSPEQQVEVGKWFGKPCLKSQKKVFLVLWGQALAFKLTEPAHAQALALPGARLFDPRGQGHAMKEWVHVDVADANVRQELARQAYAFVVEES